MTRRGMWLYYLLAHAQRDRSERGATAVEYGLIIGVCVLVFAGSVFGLRLAIGGIFGATQTSMNNSVP